jgi:hypothetical protein
MKNPETLANARLARYLANRLERQLREQFEKAPINFGSMSEDSTFDLNYALTIGPMTVGEILKILNEEL